MGASCICASMQSWCRVWSVPKILGQWVYTCAYIWINMHSIEYGEARRLALPIWTSMWTCLPRSALSQVWCGVACYLYLWFWFNGKTHVHTSQPGIFQSTCKEISHWGYVCGLQTRIRRILNDLGRFWTIRAKMSLSSNVSSTCRIGLTDKPRWKLFNLIHSNRFALNFFWMSLC